MKDKSPRLPLDSFSSKAAALALRPSPLPHNNAIERNNKINPPTSSIFFFVIVFIVNVYTNRACQKYKKKKKAVARISVVCRTHFKRNQTDNQERALFPFISSTV